MNAVRIGFLGTSDRALRVVGFVRPFSMLYLKAPSQLSHPLLRLKCMKFPQFLISHK